MADKQTKIALILTAYDRMTQVVRNATQGVENSLTRLQNSKGFKTFDKLGTQALVAGGVMAAGIYKSIEAAEEAEIANARLAQVFKSMGENTGVAAQKASEYASTLSMQIAQEDEVIMLTQAKLATFQAVSNETARMSGIFDRATRAAFDLAAAGFGEASANAAQLGKALQDPVKGLTALRKAGVTFTEQEREKIKTLMESGRAIEAQKLVLDAIEKQVGGVASATASDTAKMRIAFGEVVESIGGAFLPAVRAVADVVLEVVPKIKKFIEENQTLVKWAGKVAIALIAFGVVAKVFVGSVNLIVNTIGAATKIIGVLSKTIMLLTSPMGLVVVAVAAVAVAAYLIYRHWGTITAWFKRMWESIKALFMTGLNWLKNNWGKVILGLVFPVAGVGMLIIAAIKKFFPKLYEAGANIIKSLWNGMKAMASKPVEAIKDIVKKVRDYLPFSPAKEGPLKDIHRIRLVETIADSMKPSKAVAAMRNVVQHMVSVVAGGAPQNGAAAVAVPAGATGGSVQVNFNVSFSGQASREGATNFIDQLKKYEPELMRVINEAMNRNSRKKFA